VPTPAPGAQAPQASRRDERIQSSDKWIHSFLAADANRTRRKAHPLTWTLLLCTAVPMSLWNRSEDILRADNAAPAPSSVVADTTSAPSQGAVVPGATTESTTKGSLAGSSVDSASQTPINPATSVDASATTQTPATQSADATPHPLTQLPEKVGRELSIRAIVSGKTMSRRVMVPLKGASVGEVLLSMGIKLSPLDRVSPVPKSNAYSGMTVRVTRVSAPIRKRRVAIPTETRYQPTTAIRSGAQKLVQAGKPGAVEITERVWTLNGKVSQREFVSRRVVAQAQPRIVALGTRSAYMPGQIPYHKRYARSFSLSARGGSPRSRFLSPSGTSFRAVKSMTLVATGYSPDPRENGGYTTTATGLPIGYGAAAVDPRVIPLGTKLYVEGYGYAFACDTGGAIKGHRIDLAYNSYYEANTKGRKKVKVWILGR
jgi:3D (Asp-Asp-Asp) domain-containing protein